MDRDPMVSRESSQENLSNGAQQMELDRLVDNASPKEVELDKKFETLCSGLNTDNETQATAWVLMKNFLSSLQTAQTKREEGYGDREVWSACALYVAGYGKPNTTPLSSLLKNTNTRVFDFFQPLKEFIKILKLDSSEWEKQIAYLEQKFLMITILFMRYKKEFEYLFRFEHNPTNSVPLKRGKESDGSRIFEFGWVFFLFLKGKLLREPPDMVGAFDLLLCCLNLLLIHAPPNFRALKLEAAQMEKYDDPAKATLALLCEKNSTPLKPVTDFLSNQFTPYIKHLWQASSSSQLKCNPIKIPEDIFAKCYFIGGLLESVYLKSNLAVLNKEYDVEHYRSGDSFDERWFITNPNFIGDPSRASRQSYQFFGLPLPSSDEASTSLVPFELVRSPAPTPIRQTLDSVSWIDHFLTHQGDGPSPTLLKYIANGEESSPIADAIQSRIISLSQIVTQPNKKKNGIAPERVKTAVRLHYKLLEMLLVSEESRLQRVTQAQQTQQQPQDIKPPPITPRKTVDFTSMLTQDQFQRSLFCFCMEIICYLYKITLPTGFDLVSMLSIIPFELCIVIVTVTKLLRADMPDGLEKNINKFLEKLVEVRVWEENSPIFELFELNQSQKRLETGDDDNGQRKPVSALYSPVKGQSNPRAASNTPAFHKLSLFCRLLESVLQKKVKEVNVTPFAAQDIQRILMKLFFEHSSIIKGRHLDQIIICSLYIFSRIYDLKDLSFKKILSGFRNIPAQIYRNVKLPGGQTGDIIKFYNDYFVRELEEFFLEAKGMLHISDVAKSPAPTSFSDKEHVLGKLKSPTTTLASPGPTKVFQGHVYLSPLKGPLHLPNTPISPNPLSIQTPQTQQSPATSLSYCFGESPSKDLSKINRNINRSSIRKRLHFSSSEGNPLKRSKSSDSENQPNSQNEPFEFPLPLVELADAAEMTQRNSESGAEEKS